MPTTKLNNGQLPATLSSKTIDNTNDINTTTTRLKITGGSNGQVLSTDGSGNLSWATAGGGGLGAPTAVVTKTGDETITNSVVMQDDNHLTWTGFTAGKSYFVLINLLFTRANTTNNQGLLCGFSGNSNGYINAGGAGVLADSFSSITGVASGAYNTSTPIPIVLRVALKATANFTGTFRFAQGTLNSTGATVMRGSQMLIWEVA